MVFRGGSGGVPLHSPGSQFEIQVGIYLYTLASIYTTIEVGLTLLAGMNWNSHALGMKN